jgi:hypothetical protein
MDYETMIGQDRLPAWLDGQDSQDTSPNRRKAGETRGAA